MTTSIVLDTALRLIKDTNWVKGSYTSINDAGEFDGYCLLGSIGYAQVVERTVTDVFEHSIDTLDLIIENIIENFAHEWSHWSTLSDEEAKRRSDEMFCAMITPQTSPEWLYYLLSWYQKTWETHRNCEKRRCTTDTASCQVFYGDKACLRLPLISHFNDHPSRQLDDIITVLTPPL